MAKTTHTMLVFVASKIPNLLGELNWYEFREVADLRYSTLQTAVDGYITHLPCKSNVPHANEYLNPYVALANEEGLLNPHLGRNDLAGGVLAKLGFGGHETMGYAYAGNVVVLKSINEYGGEGGLTEEDKQFWISKIEEYKREWDNSEDSSMEEDSNDDDDDDD
jgi:hypothetical protein